ncbi:PKD domain-containing protein, partial [Patescibacteria group bacterium]|nr:PKD domain-containing protein [Patescibacteria group bacterium]
MKLSLKLTAISLLILLSLPLSASAEQSTETEDTGGENIYIQAQITPIESIEVNKNVILDGSKSFVTEDEQNPAIYEWNFGDGNKNEGKEVLHTYKTPGAYTITLKVKA